MVEAKIKGFEVSIQLVSPASGEFVLRKPRRAGTHWFPFN